MIACTGSPEGMDLTTSSSMASSAFFLPRALLHNSIRPSFRHSTGLMPNSVPTSAWLPFIRPPRCR